MPSRPPERQSGPVESQHAKKPMEISVRGWKAILIRVYREFGDDQLLLVAAGITFYLLLGMVPALTALISIYGVFFDPASAANQVAVLSNVLPEGAREILSEQLMRLAAQADGTLGATAIIGLVLALWSARGGIRALLDGMNVAYGEREKRGFFHVTLTSLIFTLAATVLLVALISATVVVPAVLQFVGLGTLTEWVARIGSGIVVLILAVSGLASLYRWGPSREAAKWRWITPGAIVAVVFGAIASVLFSGYVSNFGSYNATYGSLGAIIGFMTWVWIMVTVILLGAELNAEMEHQTARDTTTGPVKPMGSRGARMADSVAIGGSQN